MALVPILKRPYHENWSKTDAHAGGAANVEVQTVIPYTSSTGDENVDATLVLNTVVGQPAFTMAYSSVSGRLKVTVANIAAQGNSAMWTLDIRQDHTQLMRVKS